ncbi:cell division ATP-binding protein FtsE [Roseburia sp. CAG:380]|nr:cell division ATP-binding protein FtsE [Roseburia sp. CAG:380]
MEKWGKGMTGIKTFGNNETAETIIRMQNVNLVYPTGTAALKDCSLEIGKGEFVFIVGSSGSGKSTLIKTLLGELEISSGRIEVAGKDLANMTRKELPYFRRKLGVVFQEFRLLDEMNVFENVALAQRVVGVSSRERRRKNSLAMLEMVGLSKKLKAYPNELSGGEQQRVAIARAMVNRPAILLADEPTGNLDPENSWEIMKLLQDVHELGTTILVVSHNEDIVNKMQKRVITLHKGQITSDARQGGYLQ